MCDTVTSSSGQNKCQRPNPRNGGFSLVGNNAFVWVNDTVDNGGGGGGGELNGTGATHDPATTTTDCPLI